MIASLRERSASLINYSAPPHNKIVAVFEIGHSVKKLKRSAPTTTSSKTPQVPKISYFKSVTVVYITAPVAFPTHMQSSLLTRPAQNIFQSAKNCVAKSPIGSLDRTTFAPDATINSSLL